MTLSLLQHLRETQGAALVGEVTERYGLSVEKATVFINAALALVVGRLVHINQTQGTSTVLEILDKHDTSELWKNTNFSDALKELSALGGTDENTNLQALNLIGERSLSEIHNLEQIASLGKDGINELLEGQPEHLQGHFPDWIYAAAGLPALIGLGVFNAVKESVASLGSILKQAGEAIAETASDVAHVASDMTTTALDSATEAASTIADKTVDAAGAVADTASEIANKTSAATVAAVTATSAAASSAVHAASDALHKTAHTASDTVSRVNHAAIHVVKEPTSFLLRALPWLGLAVLVLLGLLFWKGCQGETVPVVASTANTMATIASPETLTINTGANGELLNCTGIVGHADLLANFTDAIKAQFGPAAKCDIKVNAHVATSFGGLAGLNESLGAIKSSPNTNFALSGDTVTINTATASENSKLAERLKTLFGTGVTIITPIPSDPTDAAAYELANINPNTVKAEDVIHALNLQVINFAVGSNEIPDVNKLILDKAATLIKAIPQLNIAITGHTDSSGNEKSNVALSTARAKSVATYLANQGVPATSITAKGLGSSKPIADNATEEGKLKNRRITFAIEGATGS
ncbi:MAG: OmpA family protein [Candidatus Saccharibacteria bacterium]|nr:OmpA family protein [Moraxellaceae bacterium]